MSATNVVPTDRNFYLLRYIAAARLSFPVDITIGRRLNVTVQQKSHRFVEGFQSCCCWRVKKKRSTLKAQREHDCKKKNWTDLTRHSLKNAGSVNCGDSLVSHTLHDTCSTREFTCGKWHALVSVAFLYVLCRRGRRHHHLFGNESSTMVAR